MIQNQNPKVFQSQLETPVINVFPNSEHIYKIRKSLVKQSENQQSRTLRSTGNVSNNLCYLCNNRLGVQAVPMCICIDRCYHPNCVMENVHCKKHLGISVFKCNNCNMFYPLFINEEFSLKNLNRKEKLQLAVFLTLIIALLSVQILILSIFNLNLGLLILIIICLIITILFSMILFRRYMYLCYSIEFEFKELRIGQRLSQNECEHYAIKILKAFKFNRANRMKTDDLQIKLES